MYKLYYVPNSEVHSIPDGKLQSAAYRLNDRNVFSSNHTIIWIARVLVMKKKINPFILVLEDGSEYPFDESGWKDNIQPPDEIDISFMMVEEILGLKHGKQN